MHTSRWRTYRRLSTALGLAGALVAVGIPAAYSASAEEQAAVYYVSPSGADSNDGASPETAWKSLGKVSQAGLEPGDTVRFERGGTWSGGLDLSGSGTANAPIVVETYGNGHRPIIRKGDTCVLIDGSHWVIRGLRASDCGWAGFEIQGRNNELRNVRADHNVAGVSIPEGSSFNLIKGSQLIDNNKMSVNTPGGDDDSGAFGVLLNGDDNTITENTISGSFAESYDYGLDGAAVEVYNGSRNAITYNYTNNNETFTELGVGDGTSADNVYAYNRVASDLESGFFLVTRGPDGGFGPVTGTVMVNNSVRMPAADAEGWVCYGGCAPDILKLRNNVISVGGQIGYEDGEGADEDTSVYQGSGMQFELGPNSVESDPGFVSDTDLHLTENSPAIERGEDLGYDRDLDGNQVPANHPDAGAYQH